MCDGEMLLKCDKFQTDVRMIIPNLCCYKFIYHFISREMGIYAKTFYKIFIQDIRKFAMVLTVFLQAFAGSVYIALAASKAFNDDFRWVEYYADNNRFKVNNTGTMS